MAGTRKRKAKLLTRPQLAAKFDVHPQTVTKWEAAGLPIAKRGRRGIASKYDEAECRAWLEAREAQAASVGPDVDLVRERARQSKAQALLLEQTFATRAKRLLPAEDVEREWADHVQAVRTRLLAMPDALADRLCQCALEGGATAVEAALDDAVCEVLRELAGVGDDVADALAS